MSLSHAIFGEINSVEEASSLPSLFRTVDLPQKPPPEDAAPKKRKREDSSVSRHKETPTSTQTSGPPANDPQEGAITIDRVPIRTPFTAEAAEEKEARTVFVGNLPLQITRKELASLFQRCGHVESARLRSVATTGVKVAPELAGHPNRVKKIAVNTRAFLADSPKTTAQGYVVFADVASVERALLWNQKLVSIRLKENTEEPVQVTLRVDHAKPTIDASRSVFVGNLPYAADEVTLQEHFKVTCGWKDEDKGVIDHVRIVRDPSTMRCKGFGYVLFQEKASIPEALKKVNQSVYMSRTLRVLVCGKNYKSKQRTEEKTETNQRRKRAFEGNRATDIFSKRSTLRKLANESNTSVEDTKKALLFLKKSSSHNIHNPRKTQPNKPSKKDKARSMSRKFKSKK